MTRGKERLLGFFEVPKGGCGVPSGNQNSGNVSKFGEKFGGGKIPGVGSHQCEMCFGWRYCALGH